MHESDHRLQREESRPSKREDTGNCGKDDPFLYIHKVPIYFCEDWRTGIGGGLWSTGLALARYFGTNHAATNLRKLLRTDRPTVLELGSGNGFLAVCLAALASAHNIDIETLVVTDFKDHLHMIQDTITANSHALRTVRKVTVMEHQWGVFSTASKEVDAPDCSTVVEQAVENGSMKFDLILGSDVAYREHLCDPLIQSILQLSHAKTVSLIGVCMTDTTPDFFRRLDRSGLIYERLADHLVEPEYRGTTFGLFAISKREKTNSHPIR